jgi:hypothetical protein
MNNWKVRVCSGFDEQKALRCIEVPFLAAERDPRRVLHKQVVIQGNNHLAVVDTWVTLCG